MKLRSALIICLMMFVSSFSKAQVADSILFEEYRNMSLEELSNIKITIASKKEENRFESPVSTYIITQKDMQQAGCLNIMEAFRLVPGLIVRQTTPGAYDIHLRGYDNIVNVNYELTYYSNSITLVMIDNRPVYNYFQGGTFWETLPLGIAEIERIEFINGASSAMYGPNAVAGVINIITKKEAAGEVHVTQDLQLSSGQNLVSSTSILAPVNSRLTIGGSLNRTFFERDYDKYFSYSKDTWVPVDSLRFGSTSSDARYPDIGNAADLLSGNLRINYQGIADNYIDFSAGYQESEVQKIYVNNQVTPLTTNGSKSSYLNLVSQTQGFLFNLAHMRGYQNTYGMMGWEYDFNTTDALIEYSYKYRGFSLRPGVGFRNATYDDAKAIEEYGTERALLSGRKAINTFSGLIRTEYVLSKFRFIAALRADKYNVPDTVYLSYQFAITYKPNQDNLLRLGYSRSNRGSFFLDSYYNQEFDYGAVQVKLMGNTNLDLLTMDLLEAGIRNKSLRNIQFDAAIYLSGTQHYAQLLESPPLNDNLVLYEFQNLDLNAVQFGASLELDYIPAANFRVRAYSNLQNTMVHNYPLSDSTSETHSHGSTPLLYGGLVLNYSPFKRLNFNLNPYYFTRQVLNSASRKDSQGNYFSVPAQLVLNVKISYQLTKGVMLFANGKNLLHREQEEVIWGDKISASYWGGVYIDL